jgi:hypothetical protein
MLYILNFKWYIQSKICEKMNDIFFVIWIKFKKIDYIIFSVFLRRFTQQVKKVMQQWKRQIKQ